MIDFKEFEFWLSGGAGNTDGGASLGGAISTAQQWGVQTFVVTAGDDTGMTGFVPMFSREVFAVDSYFLGTFKDTDPDTGEIRTYIRPDWDASYVGGFTNPASGVVVQQFTNTETGSNGFLDVTIDYDAIIAPVRDEGNPAAQNVVDFTSGVVLNQIVEVVTQAQYEAGTVLYRCFYIKNNGASNVGNLQLYLQDHGQIDTFNAGANPWTYDAAEDPAGINGTATTIVDQFTAPVGPVFTNDIFNNGLTLATPLTPGDVLPIWLRINIPAGYNPRLDLPIELLMRGWVSLYFGGDAPAPFFGVMAFDIEFPAIIGLATDTLLFVEDVPTIDQQVEEPPFSFTDSAQADVTKQAVATDVVTFSEARVADRSAVASATDSFTLNEVVAARQDMSAEASDLVTFNAEIVVDGEQWEAWVLNLDTNAVSRYLWGAFRSLVGHDGAFYGADGAGIKVLDGADDDGEPIDAFILTGVDDFDIEHDKRIPRAYIGVKASGELLLKVITGDNEVRVYRFESTNNSQMSHRVPLGRGVDAYNWQFALQNVDGADFNAECIRVHPVMMKRRFR